MADRVSKQLALEMRAAYRMTHKECWRPIYKNGLWQFCRKRPAIVDHIPRKRDGWERPEIYFPVCDFPHGNCHAGWKHGGDPHELDSKQPEGYRMLQQFAVKIIMGELREEEVQQYMRGRTWWKTEDDVTDAMSIEGHLDLIIEVFTSLQITEKPRRQQWLLSRATDIRRTE